MTEDERINIIREMTESGASCAKIAPFAECSGASVNRIQRECGMKRPSSEVVDRPTHEELLACSGMTTAEIQAKYNRGAAVVNKWFKYHEIYRVHNGRRKGVLIDLREIRLLAAQGLCAAYIAEHMGFAPATILKTARNEGIDLPVGDPNAASRERPERAEFAKNYKKFKLKELASLYGVAMGTVSKWALHYGLRAEATKRGPRLMHRSVCTRPIAGSCAPRAIDRALAKLERRA